MGALLSEFVIYIIKFLAMILCAAVGIIIGKGLRKKKNEKLASEEAQE